VSIHPATAAPVVLVADDDEYIRLLMSLAMPRVNLAPLLAADGREAVELFLRHQDVIQAVLLDVRMPVLDGPSALAQILRINPRVPCCFMTGYTDRYSGADLSALGAVQVFEKPFRPDEILQTMAKLCRPQG
jgi:CheY-like chemotaxis protein